MRQEQSERLKRINQRSEEELKSRLEVPEKKETREKEPEGKNVKFNSTLEDVCTIEEISQEWVFFQFYLNDRFRVKNFRCKTELLSRRIIFL